MVKSILTSVLFLFIFLSSASSLYATCYVGMEIEIDNKFNKDTLLQIPGHGSPTKRLPSGKYKIIDQKNSFLKLQSTTFHKTSGWIDPKKNLHGQQTLNAMCWEKKYNANLDQEIIDNKGYDNLSPVSFNSNINEKFITVRENKAAYEGDPSYRYIKNAYQFMISDTLGYKPIYKDRLKFISYGLLITSKKSPYDAKDSNDFSDTRKTFGVVEPTYVKKFNDRSGLQYHYIKFKTSSTYVEDYFQISKNTSYWQSDYTNCFQANISDSSSKKSWITFASWIVTCFDNKVTITDLDVQKFLKSLYFKDYKQPTMFYEINNTGNLTVDNTLTNKSNILYCQNPTTKRVYETTQLNCVGVDKKIPKGVYEKFYASKDSNISNTTSLSDLASANNSNIIYCQNPTTKRVYETTQLNCVGVDKKIPKGVYEKFYASKDSNISNTTSLSDLASANNSNIIYCQNSSRTGVYKSQSSCLYYDKEISKRMFDKFINSIKYVYCRSNKSNVTTRYSTSHRKDCPVGSSKTTKVAWINYKDQMDNKKQTPNIDLIFDISEVKIVNASPLNVREAPNGQWLSILSEGEKVAILEKNNDNSWSKIVSEDGQTGWVSSKYLVDDLSNIEDNNKNPKVVKQNKEIIQKQEPEIIVSKNTFDEIEPSISCSEKEIFTKEKTALIDCKISDNDEVFKVFIEGNEVKLRANRIQEEFPVVIGKSELEIQAFDISGNETKEFVIVEREFSFVNQFKQFDPLKPGLINAPINRNRIAIIIGIKDYKDIPDTKYADRDAFTFIDYANETLGINNSNIKYFINDDAGFFDFKTIDRWLSTKINKNTEVFFFYSGHGANNNGQSILLPSDFRTDLIDDTSITKVSFLQQIADQNPKHIFAFFDACFSGLSREGETLIAGLRNISIVDEEVPFSNITIFNSASDAEFSSDFDEVGHGLFSYYLMKGLEGEADANNDQQISTTELHEYIYTNVSRQSLNLGPEQNPSLISNDDQIIVKW